MLGLRGAKRQTDNWTTANAGLCVASHAQYCLRPVKLCQYIAPFPRYGHTFAFITSDPDGGQTSKQASFCYSLIRY